ncbi:hypothetical protein [Streptomyces sp. RK75]|uniref:hypothetical protein n=1 Tax=Streptomyces sp. RK75 TaxID=2824895 RepID=UPI001B38021F|nr:hypothetical protein [Streptomyces sp. RK75]MBQ0867405.1 hypothetical protein [Streptomyces sp. RK75]
MSSDGQEYISIFNVGERRRAVIGDILGQLDQVLDLNPSPAWKEGLAELTDWMSEEVSQEAAAPEEPLAAKIFVAGGTQAGAVDFIRSVAGDAFPYEAPLPGSGGLPEQAYCGTFALAPDMALGHFAPAGTFPTAAWGPLVDAALGAVVVTDPKRLEDSFPALSYLESSGISYVVAVNVEQEECEHSESSLREALSLGGQVPMTFGKLPSGASAKASLIALVEMSLQKSKESRRLDEELEAMMLLSQLELTP